MSEIVTRTRLRPEPEKTPLPKNWGRAGGYFVTRRVGDTSIVIGRVLPEGTRKRAYVRDGETWNDLGLADDGSAALAAITSAFDRLQRGAKRSH